MFYESDILIGRHNCYPKLQTLSPQAELDFSISSSSTIDSLSAAFGRIRRAEGLRLLNRLSPLSPVYIQDDAQEKMSIAAGWTPGKRVDATMPPTFPLAKKLNINPEPANAAASTLRLFVPTVEELVAESDAKGEARFLPGKGWRLLQSPPKKADQPFTPFLYLAPGAKAELKVYVPKALRGKDLTLHGFFARGKAAAQPFARKLQTSNSELQTSSGFVTIPFDGALDGCYFLYPEVK